jgi:glycosyltransferase involved in cell wall biosynthesis
MDVLGGGASGLLGIPCILSERCSVEAYPRNWKMRLREHVGLRAKMIVANSVGGIAYWRSLGYQGKMQVVQNFVAISRGNVVAASESSELPGGHILIAGRLAEQKNIGVLMEALISAANARADLLVDICGDGPLRDQIAQQIAKAGLHERILLHGYVDNLSDRMRDAGMFVSISNFEGHPNTVIEAAAIGCPLILSDIPAHREFLDDSAAWYVDHGNPVAVCDAILKLVENSALGATRAQNAQTIAGGFSLPCVADSYEKIYRNIFD